MYQSFLCWPWDWDNFFFRPSPLKLNPPLNIFDETILFPGVAFPLLDTFLKLRPGLLTPLDVTVPAMVRIRPLAPISKISSISTPFFFFFFFVFHSPFRGRCACRARTQFMGWWWCLCSPRARLQTFCLGYPAWHLFSFLSHFVAPER